MTAQTELDNAESSIPSIDPLQPPESVHTFRLFTAREAKERQREKLKLRRLMPVMTKP